MTVGLTGLKAQQAVGTEGLAGCWTVGLPGYWTEAVWTEAV